MHVVFIVMKTKDRNYYDFGSRSLYPKEDIYSEDARNEKRFKDQQFIVPWQMEHQKKNEIQV
jgi:hypothetical protein